MKYHWETIAQWSQHECRDETGRLLGHIEFDRMPSTAVRYSDNSRQQFSGRDAPEKARAYVEGRT